MLLAYKAQVYWIKVLLLQKYTTYTTSRDAKKKKNDDLMFMAGMKQETGSAVGFISVLKLEMCAYWSWNLNRHSSQTEQKQKVHSNLQFFHPCLLIWICSHTDRVTRSPYRWRSCQDVFSTARICYIEKFDSAVLTSCSQLILMGWAPIQPMNLNDKIKTC